MVPSIYVSLTLMKAGISKISVLIVQPLGHHGKRLAFKKKILQFPPCYGRKSVIFPSQNTQ